MKSSRNPAESIEDIGDATWIEASLEGMDMPSVRAEDRLVGGSGVGVEELV